MKRISYKEKFVRYCERCGSIVKEEFEHKGYDRMTGEKFFVLRKTCPNYSYRSPLERLHDNYVIQDEEEYYVRFYEDSKTGEMQYYAEEQQ